MKEIEKQAIEEMAAVIERTEQIARDAHCGLPSPTMYAKDLYWHGYRRLPKTTEDYQGQLQNDITECYGCDPMYYGTDGAFLAENLVKMGWRKQIEGEWVERLHPIYGDVEAEYSCSVCGVVEIDCTNYCSNCGAKMKGGAE